MTHWRLRWWLAFFSNQIIFKLGCVHFLDELLLYTLLLLFSSSVMSHSLWHHEWPHARPPCPSPSPRACSNSCPFSRWCHPTISSSVILFSSCLQSFPASGSFPTSQLFASGGQRIDASASVLPKNIQDWFSLGWTGLISLQSKGLSRVFSNTTVQKHQFFSVQPSLQMTAWYEHNFYMYWETKQCLFALLWWSGTEAQYL